MVDTLPVDGRDHFITIGGEQEEDPLNRAQRGELWDLWSQFIDEHGDCKLVLVPEWFSESEYGARRPYLFAQVEHDDSSSGAVLFSSTQMVNISVVENEVFGDVPLHQTFDVLDVSQEDDYIDESGKVWIPRSLMTVFDRV